MKPMHAASILLVGSLMMGLGAPPQSKSHRQRVSAPKVRLKSVVNNKKKDTEQNTTQNTAHDSDRWQDSFSREPMWFIQLHIGEEYSGDPLGRGRAPWWYADDGVDWLVNEIKRAYAFGARRFWCNRPMGAPKTVAVPGASWLTMSDERRSDITREVTDLLLDECPDAEIYWYTGSDMTDPRVYNGGTQGRDAGFFGLGATSTPKQLTATRATIGGWLSTGAAGLGVDHTAMSSKRDQFISLFNALRGEPFHFSLIGESIPLIQNSVRLGPDFDAVAKMPWVIVYGVLLERIDESVVFDREDSRVFVWFAGAGHRYGSVQERKRIVDECMDRGLIVITMDRDMFLEAKAKAREMGDIE